MRGGHGDGKGHDRGTYSGLSSIPDDTHMTPTGMTLPLRSGSMSTTYGLQVSSLFFSFLVSPPLSLRGPEHPSTQAPQLPKLLLLCHSLFCRPGGGRYTESGMGTSDLAEPPPRVPPEKRKDESAFGASSGGAKRRKREREREWSGRVGVVGERQGASDASTLRTPRPIKSRPRPRPRQSSRLHDRYTSAVHMYGVQRYIQHSTCSSCVGRGVCMPTVCILGLIHSPSCVFLSFCLSAAASASASTSASASPLVRRLPCPFFPSVVFLFSSPSTAFHD